MHWRARRSTQPLGLIAVTTSPFKESKRKRVAKFVAVLLATIGIAVGAFAVSVYLTDAFALRVPTANLCLAILLCIAGLAFSVSEYQGRGSWKRIMGIALPALIAAAVALRFGMPGVTLAFFLICLAYYAQRWWRASRLPKSDET
jgi:hypothetical protein